MSAIDMPEGKAGELPLELSEESRNKEESDICT